MKKSWVAGLLGAFVCVIAGDVASILCGRFRVEGFAGTLSWIAPLAGFVYFFFFKFWNKTEEIDMTVPGRMRRLKYFVNVFVMGLAVGVALEITIGICCLSDNSSAVMLEWFAQIVGSSIMTLVLFRYTVWRLHDIGWTCKVAKWQVLMAMLTLMGFMFPTLAAIVILVSYIPNFVLGLILLFHGGTAGENKYGANPRIK